MDIEEKKHFILKLNDEEFEILLRALEAGDFRNFSEISRIVIDNMAEYMRRFI